VRRALLTLLLLTSSALPACTDEPAAVLGTGTDDWEPLGDGGSVPIEFGSQGGFHVYASVRVRGIHPGTETGDTSDNPLTRFDLRMDDTSVVESRTGDRAFEPVPSPLLGGWTHELRGTRLVFDGLSDSEVTNETFTLTVFVVDRDGVEVRDSIQVSVTRDPFGQDNQGG